MSPQRRFPGGRQTGSALIAALFLMIVIAALSVYALRIAEAQQQTVNLELRQYRAFAAAQSALEFATYQAYAGGACVANMQLTFQSGAGLANETADVDCLAGTHAYNGVPPSPNVFDLSARVSLGAYGSADFVQRTLSKRVTSIGPGAW